MSEIIRPPIVDPKTCSVLAIDSAFDICSVALLTADLRDIRVSQHVRKHADDVLVMVQQILQQNHHNLSEVDVIAMSAGPGSFTGLRIGTAVVQGLAFGAARPVACVSSLAALAMSAASQHPADLVIPCVHARENEFYFAMYRPDSARHPDCVRQDCIATPDNIAQWLAQENIATAPLTLAVGDGWQQPAMQTLAHTLGLVSVTARYDALTVGELARYAFNAGQTVPAALAAPVYLKDELEYRTV